MPVFQITQPKGLTREEWTGLRGTPLYEMMVRNRIHIEVETFIREEAHEVLAAWLSEHVSKLYFDDYEYSISGEWIIYFEDAAEMVAFTLAHHGEEVPDVDGDLGRRVPPHQSGGGMPMPNIIPPKPSPWALPPHSKPWLDEDGVWQRIRAVYGADISDAAASILGYTKVQPRGGGGIEDWTE